MEKSNIIFIPAQDGNVIFHTLTRTSWIISDNPALLEVLKHYSTHFSVTKRKNGRRDARITITDNGCIVARPYLSRIAYDCYYKGLTDKSVANFYASGHTELSNSSDYPTIDHLDCDQSNNRKENVFEMTREENKRKYQKPQKIKGNRCITLANDDGRCKIQYAYTDYKGIIRVLRYICWDSQSINACLDYLYLNRYRIANSKQGEVIEYSFDYEVSFIPLPFKRFAYKIRAINSHALAARVARMPDNRFFPITTY